MPGASAAGPEKVATAPPLSVRAELPTMAETLELPTGETVTPEEPFLFEGYPFRFRPVDDDAEGFELSPLYWGGGQMDQRFESRAELVDRWADDPDTRGVLTDAEWRTWIEEARDDDRFVAEELDAIERELGLATGPLSRLRSALGL
jgi:hypothetical protein